MNENKTIEWVDILKGIGIISVVIGHVFPPDSVEFIYLFHMPLFFIIAGYLYKPDPDYKGFLKKKSSHLLVPYFSFLIIMVLPYQLLKWHQGMLTIDLIKSILFGGRYLKDIGTVFWFVTCFFATQQFFNWIYTKSNGRVLFGIILLFTCFAYLNSEIYPQYWLPWNLNVVFMSLPMFYIGTIFRSHNFIFELRTVVFALALVFLVVYIFNDTYTMDMKSANYGLPILSLLASCGVIIVLINLSKFIFKLGFIGTLFSHIGKASMIIMYVHKTFRMIIVNMLFIKNLYLICLLAIVFSYFAYLFLNRFNITRVLFLGSKIGSDRVFKYGNFFFLK